MKKGFTLVELSIVLVIIGLLIGGSIQMMSMLNKRAKITEAKQQLETLKESIIGFAQTTGALPTQAQFETLGDVTDPWGKRINYYNIDNTNNLICSYTTTFSTTGIPSITNIAFALVSSGENHNMQTDLKNEKILYNQGTDNIDDNSSDIGGTRLEEYDDLFLVVSLAQLQSIADCQTNKLKIINTTLPTGTAGVAYSISPAVIASGGKSPYTYRLISNTSTSTFTSGTNTITWAAPIVGNYLLTFTVTDSLNTVSEAKQLLLTINTDPTSGNNTGGGNGGNGPGGPNR